MLSKAFGMVTVAVLCRTYSNVKEGFCSKKDEIILLGENATFSMAVVVIDFVAVKIYFFIAR